MLKVRNKFTEKLYEAIQYSYTNYEECKNFVLEHKNISIHIINPLMEIYGLTSYQNITKVNPTDFIIRTITDGMPLYKVVTEEIMKNNFETIEE